ncbi:MAG: hypothetical protein IJD09_01035 [Clostridia bacterium]|nr:hypothetical protein [Clostridia bacterium]
MSQIRGIGLIICILMVLMAYLKQAIPRGKTTYLMKAIISIFILLSIVQGVTAFDFSELKNTIESGYSRNEEVWSKTAEIVAEGLKKEFEQFLREQGMEVSVFSVSVKGDQEGFEIQKVLLAGRDAETGKKLLAGRYRIGLAYIEVQNE